MVSKLNEVLNVVYQTKDDSLNERSTRFNDDCRSKVSVFAYLMRISYFAIKYLLKVLKAITKLNDIFLLDDDVHILITAVSKHW